MTLPEVGTSPTERLGIAAVARIVFLERALGGFGWIFREMPQPDYGVDGHIELVDPTTNHALGKLLAVQVKAGASYFDRPCEAGWINYIRKSTVAYWRSYSVPVILVLVDVAKDAAYWSRVDVGDFEETDQYYKIVVPERQRFQATCADELAALAQSASGRLTAKLQRLSEEFSHATSADLERYRQSWREGSRSTARAWLTEFVDNPGRLASLDRATAAALLRFAASVMLDERNDQTLASKLIEAAKVHDPTGDDSRIRAGILLRRNDMNSALEELSASKDPAAAVMLASLLTSMGREGDALAVLDNIEPSSDVVSADVGRARARALFATGNLQAALDEIDNAARLAPRSAQIRLTRGILNYYASFVPEGRPDALPPWPTPFGREVVRSDDTGLRHLHTASDLFQELLQLDWSPEEQRFIETWRLAALLANPDNRDAATEFGAEVLKRDPLNGYVVSWIADARLKVDLTTGLAAMAQEAEREHGVGIAIRFIAASIQANHIEGLPDWMDARRDHFAEFDAEAEWLSWRSRIAAHVGDFETATTLIDQLDDESARFAKSELLEVDARRTGDFSKLFAHLENVIAITDDSRLRLETCQLYANEGEWVAILPHIGRLLKAFPTRPVRRLAIFAYYRTGNFSECLVLLDPALVEATSSAERAELLRIRADVRATEGDISGAIADLETVPADASVSETDKLTRLARFQFFAGRIADLVSTVRRLRNRPDLSPNDALAFSEMVAHDAPHLAKQLWRFAEDAGIPDELVTTAITVGYQLGLDAELHSLHMRMSELAAAGSTSVWTASIEEMLQMQRDWTSRRDLVLEQYRRGETPTHIVTEFLNIPLAEFYHIIPDVQSSQVGSRGQLGLQFRDGSRRVPDPAVAVARRATLAMDLSAVLLASHFDLLEAVEAEYAPVRLPQHTVVALKHQRDRLLPHQPSRIDVIRGLLKAVRLRQVQVAETPRNELEETVRVAAGGWAEWVAILERAKQEDAFVLDLPIEAESPHGPPLQVAGRDRLNRLVTIAELREFLKDVGTIPPESGMHANQSMPLPLEGGAQQEPALISDAITEESRPRLGRGKRVYLTDSGAEALQSSGLLTVAAETLSLVVLQEDHAQRLRQIEGLDAAATRVEWLDSLIHRISDGLEQGKYTLLPSQSDHNSPEAEDHSSISTESEGQNPTESSQAVQKGRTSRLDSLTFRCLADVINAPADLVEAVWIDDRFISRHSFTGAARITGILDVLASLTAARKIESTRRWQVQLELRASNVRTIPLSAEEVWFHLQNASVVNGEVVETRELRLLRRSAAALLRDASDLRIPTPEALARGDLGELELVRSHSSAVHEAFRQLWSSSSSTSIENRARAESLSRWLLNNLYLDMGLLRTHVVTPDAETSPDISGLDGAALLMNCLQLIDTTIIQPETSDEIARAYVEWIYASVIAHRSLRDPKYSQAVIGHLRRLLGNWPIRDADDELSNFAARALAGRISDLLPRPMREELSRDEKFLEKIGRKIVSSLTIGQWSVPTAEFARAAERLFSDNPPHSIQLTLLDASNSHHVHLSRAAESTFTLTAGDRTESVTLSDPAFRVMSPEIESQRLACQAIHDELDIADTDWDGFVNAILSCREPEDRLEAVMRAREASLDRKYSVLTERWRKSNQMTVDDFSAPGSDLVMRHLRLSEKDRAMLKESRAIDVAPEADWSDAAKNLIRQCGILTTARRYFALPIPIPRAILDAVRDLIGKDRDTFVHALLASRSGPVTWVNRARLFATFAQNDLRFARLLRLYVRRIADPGNHAHFALARWVAIEALRQKPYEHSEENATSAPARLLAAWYHADRIVAALLNVGASPSDIARWFEGRYQQRIRDLFDLDANPRDISNPQHLDAVTISIGANQYVIEELEPELIDSIFRQPSSPPLLDIVASATPTFSLLRDHRIDRNVLKSWLVPRREHDGTVRIGSTELIPAALAPDTLLREAFEELQRIPFDVSPWLKIEAATGFAPLRDHAAQEFRKVTSKLDVSRLIAALGTNARFATQRLAREAKASNDRHDVEKLRQKLLEVLMTSSDDSPGVSGSSASFGSHDLSPRETAVFEGLYRLAEAEVGPVQATRALMHDLEAMSQSQPRCLPRIRALLEMAVLQIPLSQAQQCTAFLLKARSECDLTH